MYFSRSKIANYLLTLIIIWKCYGVTFGRPQRLNQSSEYNSIVGVIKKILLLQTKMEERINALNEKLENEILPKDELKNYILKEDEILKSIQNQIGSNSDRIKTIEKIVESIHISLREGFVPHLNSTITKTNLIQQKVDVISKENLEMKKIVFGSNSLFSEIIQNIDFLTRNYPELYLNETMKLNNSNSAVNTEKSLNDEENLENFQSNKLGLMESVAFHGNGYLELYGQLLPHSRNPEIEENVEFVIRTRSKFGLIFWQGERPGFETTDYWSVSLTNGKIMFSWSIGETETIVTSTKNINDGIPHKILITRIGTEGRVEVDEDDIDVVVSGGVAQKMYTPGNIYIGGLPNIPRMTSGRFVDGFIGCIQDVRFLEGPSINLQRNVLSSVNAGLCK